MPKFREATKACVPDRASGQPNAAGVTCTMPNGVPAGAYARATLLHDGGRTAALRGSAHEADAALAPRLERRWPVVARLVLRLLKAGLLEMYVRTFQ